MVSIWELYIPVSVFGKMTELKSLSMTKVIIRYLHVSLLPIQNVLSVMQPKINLLWTLIILSLMSKVSLVVVFMIWTFNLIWRYNIIYPLYNRLNIVPIIKSMVKMCKKKKILYFFFNGIFTSVDIKPKALLSSCLTSLTKKNNFKFQKSNKRVCMGKIYGPKPV